MKKIAVWLGQKPRLAGIMAFFFLVPFVYFAISLRYKIIRENEQREMSNIVNVVQRNIAQMYKNSYTTTLTLAFTINDQGKPEDFEKVGKQLIESNPAVDAVQLVPGGVIRYIYPMKGNEPALNFDILHSSDVRQEALLSMKNRTFYFAGPLPLKQGGIGIVGRLPVYKKNVFWGFSAVVIRMETLIRESGIADIDDSKYFFQFSKTDPKTGKEVIYFNPKEKTKGKFFIKETIPEGNWNIYLVSRQGDNVLYQVYTSLILGFLLCLIFGLWVYSIMKKPAEQSALILEQAKILVENEVKFKTLFEQAPVGIAKVALGTGLFLESNTQMSKITLYTEEELKTIALPELLPKADLVFFQSRIDEVHQQPGEEFTMETQIITKSGRKRWVNLVVTPLGQIESAQDQCIIILEDIDLKKNTEEELHKSFDLVNEQNKRLLNFSYIVSHNLRSHSSNIKSISTLMEEADTPEEQQELMDMLKKVSLSLQETMNNLNEVINIQSNLGLHRESLPLKHYVDNTLNALSEQIHHRQVTVLVEVDDEATVVHNAAYLESILLNLISNAVKYAAHDRNPLIKIKYDCTKNTLTLSDNGIGIDLKKHGENLFGMYKTFHNNPDAKGLGLFITKNQIEAMGGKIQVESEPNVGTTFTIQFATN